MIFTEVSYLFFSYSDLVEKGHQFNQQDFIKFFFDPTSSTMDMSEKSTSPRHCLAKFGKICNDSELPEIMNQETELLKKVWEKHFKIYSNPIYRFVLKLELKAEVAAAYYKDKKYNKIASAIIAVREDVITVKSAEEVKTATWGCGSYSEIDKEHYTALAAQKHSQNSPCSIM